MQECSESKVMWISNRAAVDLETRLLVVGGSESTNRASVYL